MATYSPNWQAQALAEGKDVNSPEFASFRAQDQTRSPASSVGSSDDYVKRAIEQYKQAVQPAVQSYQASKPEIQSTYASTRSRQEKRIPQLQERYKALIDDINRRGEVAETQQTRTTNAELARRGIVSDSGVAQQEMTNAVNPIRAQYAGLAKDAGLSQEEDIMDIENLIADLTGQEVSALRGVDNAIASLLSNAGMQGVTTGTGNYQFDVNKLLQEQQMAEQARQSELSRALQQASLDQSSSQFDKTFGENQRQFNVQQANKGSGTGLDASTEMLLQKIFGGNVSSTDAIAAGKSPVPGTNNYVVGRTPSGGYLYRDAMTGKFSQGPGGFMNG